LHFKLSKFGRKSVLLLLICMQSIYAIIKIVSEKTCFLALLKNCLNRYTIIIKQRVPRRLRKGCYFARAVWRYESSSSEWMFHNTNSSASTQIQRHRPNPMLIWSVIAVFMNISWKVLNNPVDSDHLPIVSFWNRSCFPKKSLTFLGPY
jgi:hypothetical protein